MTSRGETSWQTRAFRAGAIVLLVAMVPAYAVSFRRAWHQGSDRASWTRVERELAGATAAEVDPAVFLAARRTIPAGATYVLVVGERGVTPHAKLLVRPFSMYALLPRRLVDDVADAEWVVAYGTGLPIPGVRVGRLVRVAPGMAVAEVAR